MTSEKITAQLVGMPPERLKKLWFSAMRIVMSGKGDIEAARKMLDDIESIERNGERSEATETVGELNFEPHGHGYVSFGYADRICVATIRKTEQHRLSGNHVYQVSVLGKALYGACRSIADARALAAQVYETRDA